jgi:transcription antitermination factor NusG
VHKIAGWVSFGDVVPSITDEVMTDLMKQVDAINGANGLWRRFKVGEKVRVDSGPFQGLAEVIEEAKSPSTRALVLLQFMGRLVQTQVPWVDLQPGSNLPVEPAEQVEMVRSPRRTRGRGRWIRGHRPVAATIP